MAVWCCEVDQRYIRYWITLAFHGDHKLPYVDKNITLSFWTVLGTKRTLPHIIIPHQSVALCPQLSIRVTFSQCLKPYKVERGCVMPEHNEAPSKGGQSGVSCQAEVYHNSPLRSWKQLHKIFLSGYTYLYSGFVSQVLLKQSLYLFQICLESHNSADSYWHKQNMKQIHVSCASNDEW